RRRERSNRAALRPETAMAIGPARRRRGSRRRTAPAAPRRAARISRTGISSARFIRPDHRARMGASGASMRARRLVQPVAQLLPGLEERDVLLGDLDAVAGARVAADTGVAALHREGAEAAQLDPIAARQGRGDLVEDRGDDDLDVALIEMRVGFGQPL